jgi:hypothetical protein
MSGKRSPTPKQAEWLTVQNMLLDPGPDQGEAAPLPPEEIQEFLPKRLRTAHLAAALDKKPSDIKYLLDSEQIESHRSKSYKWREVEWVHLILYAARERLDIDWDAVIEIELERAA